MTWVPYGRIGVTDVTSGCPDVAVIGEIDEIPASADSIAGPYIVRLPR